MLSFIIYKQCKWRNHITQSSIHTYLQCKGYARSPLQEQKEKSVFYEWKDTYIFFTHLVLSVFQWKDGSINALSSTTKSPGKWWVVRAFFKLSHKQKLAKVAFRSFWGLNEIFPAPFMCQCERNVELLAQHCAITTNTSPICINSTSQATVGSSKYIWLGTFTLFALAPTPSLIPWVVEDVGPG